MPITPIELYQSSLNSVVGIRRVLVSHVPGFDALERQFSADERLRIDFLGFKRSKLYVCCTAEDLSRLLSLFSNPEFYFTDISDPDSHLKVYRHETDRYIVDFRWPPGNKNTDLFHVGLFHESLNSTSGPRKVLSDKLEHVVQIEAMAALCGLHLTSINIVAPREIMQPEPEDYYLRAWYCASARCQDDYAGVETSFRGSLVGVQDVRVYDRPPHLYSKIVRCKAEYGRMHTNIVIEGP